MEFEHEHELRREYKSFILPIGQRIMLQGFDRAFFDRSERGCGWRVDLDCSLPRTWSVIAYDC